MRNVLLCVALTAFSLLAFQKVTDPIVIYRVEPEYTSPEREARIEGDVQLSTLIDIKGVPTEIMVQKSLHPRLDARAMAALSQWRYKPALRNGDPVAVRKTVSLSFRLK
jgi:periplasmic protein TonB